MISAFSPEAFGGRPLVGRRIINSLVKGLFAPSRYQTLRSCIPLRAPALFDDPPHGDQVCSSQFFSVYACVNAFWIVALIGATPDPDPLA